jgi:two-component system, LuxR family, response regulator FixJ
MPHSESTSTYAFSLNKDRLVFVVDADLQSCRVIAAAIKFEGYEVLQIHNVLDLFAKLQDRTPDAVIINSRIGDESGVTAIQLMQQRVPLAVTVMIQDTAELKSATAAMRLGVADVLEKPVDIEHLSGLLRAGLSTSLPGKQSLPYTTGTMRGVRHLTRREREVLQMITTGLSNKEAALKLGISSRTVEVHRLHVMHKLGARNTADLMRMILTNPANAPAHLGDAGLSAPLQTTTKMEHFG